MKFVAGKSVLKIVVVLALMLSVRAPSAEITVFAAASLNDILKKIAADYEKQSVDRIRFNFGASSTLARQIEEGAPADIFFSADEARMDGLEKKDRIVKATRRSRLSNSLVIVVPVHSALQITSANNLTNAEIKRIALADPKTVPAGIYAKAYLEKMELWPSLKLKVVPTDSVRGALAAVESGNIEAGMVYKTDASISRKVKVAYEIPMEDCPKISYPMAVVNESKHPEAAKKFFDYLGTEEAAGVFKKFGFIVQEK